MPRITPMSKSGVSLPPRDWLSLDALAASLTKDTGERVSRSGAIRSLIRAHRRKKNMKTKTK